MIIRLIATFLERRLRLYRSRGVHLLDKALKYAAGTQLGELGHAVGQHILDDIGPAYRGGELGDQVGLDLLRIGICLLYTSPSPRDM